MPDAASMCLESPPSLAARELHEILVRSHASANLGRKRFADGLRALHESKLFQQLGFPNVYAYSEAHFRYRHAQTHEFIQVSRRLLSLPRISGAFERGEISWRLAARLSEVATAETEEEWRRFLDGRRVGAVLAEVDHCKLKSRASPRRDGFGLPGLPVRVSFELSTEENALFERGIEKVRGEIAQSLDGERLEPKDVLLVLMRRILETDPEGGMTRGRKESGLSPFTIVVHRCSSCARGALDTEDGRVELEAKALERIGREAQRVVLEETEPERKEPLPPGVRDKPNTPALRRAICQREGGRCANPYCNRLVGPDGHAHHIQALALGGATELSNEVYLCGLCHAVHHAGLLSIERDPVLGIVFRPISTSLTRAIREELEAARALPEVKTVEVQRPVSGCPESRDDHRLARLALEKLGFTAREARRRLELVLERSPQAITLSLGDLLKETLKL